MMMMMMMMAEMSDKCMKERLGKRKRKKLHREMKSDIR
jgi:hypothetical protein